MLTPCLTPIALRCDRNLANLTSPLTLNNSYFHREGAASCWWQGDRMWCTHFELSTWYSVKLYARLSVAACSCSYSLDCSLPPTSLLAEGWSAGWLSFLCVAGAGFTFSRDWWEGRSTSCSHGKRNLLALLRTAVLQKPPPACRSQSVRIVWQRAEAMGRKVKSSC